MINPRIYAFRLVPDGPPCDVEGLSFRVVASSGGYPVRLAIPYEQSVSVALTTLESGAKLAKVRWVRDMGGPNGAGWAIDWSVMINPPTTPPPTALEARFLHVRGTGTRDAWRTRKGNARIGVAYELQIWFTATMGPSAAVQATEVSRERARRRDLVTRIQAVLNKEFSE